METPLKGFGSYYKRSPRAPYDKSPNISSHGEGK